MENEADIIESLSAIGYSGPCRSNDVLTEALTVGTKSEAFREVVGWVAFELHVLRKTDEKVDKDSEFNEFAMELSAMLKELGCPFKQFIDGPLSSRYQTKQSRIQLLEYLITELMTTKMCLKQKPIDDSSFVIPKFETNTARALEAIAKDLGLGKPPENIAPRALFDKLNFKLEETKRGANKQLVGDSLLKLGKQLSETQWKKLEGLQKSIDDEYNLRRQVLITRLEVTVQSFQWSERMRGNEELIANKYQSKMEELDKYRYGGADTDIIALLAARTDLAIIEKTSSANVRKNTGTKIQKHVIGSVPDRGGRANEHAPPPPEMPSWQTQRSSGPGGRGGFAGRGGGGDRGGFRGGRGGGGGNWQQGGANNNSGGGGGGNWQQGGNNNNSGGGGNNFQQSNQGGNWLTGSGRAQGAGWQPKGNFNEQSNNNFNTHSFNDSRSGQRDNYSGGGGGFGGSDSSNSYGNQQQNNQRGGGGGYNRGKSNYNRGGGGRGGGGRGGYRNN